MTGGASIQPISGEATVTTKTDRKRKLPLVVRSGSYDAHLKGFAVDRGTGCGGTLDKRKERFKRLSRAKASSVFCLSSASRSIKRS
jgi:hypothetical protein